MSERPWEVSLEEWIALSDLANQCSSRQIEDFIRENIVVLRGEFCADYTQNQYLGRDDPKVIPRWFILNSSFDLENGKLYAIPDYAMYSHVKISLESMRKFLGQKRDRRVIHEWELIEEIIARVGQGWEGSQAALVREVREEYKRLRPGVAVPEESTIKKGRKLHLHAALAKSGA